jgi:hypothetical protein
MNGRMIKRCLMLSLSVSMVSSVARANGPDPSDVYVESISYGGSGCPQGTVGQSISDDRTVFTLIYDQFVASRGPGVPLSESFKECDIHLNLHVPQGWQFSITGVDYRGYVQLPHGMTAHTSSLYFFENAVLDVAHTQANFVGPVTRDYLTHASIGIESLVWSACNEVEPLVIKHNVRLHSGKSETGEGQITTDSIDGKVTHVFGIQWKRC